MGVTARGSPHRDRIEPRGFDEDVLRLGGDHGVVAAHDAGQRDGAAMVGDDEIVRDQGAGGSVEQAELLAGPGVADDDAALDLVEIEDVVGMAHAEEHEGDRGGVAELEIDEGLREDVPLR